MPDEPDEKEFNGEQPPGFLELVYGVLLEPKEAMARVAARPPLGLTALVVAVLSLVGAIMFYLAGQQVLSGHYGVFGQFFLPVVIIFFLVFGCFKWFLYSAVLHLAAELFGGKGSARAVTAVVGLSGLPSVFLVPLQFIVVFFFPRAAAGEITLLIAALAVAVWSFVLIIIGIKAAHSLSTGRALLSVLTPVFALLLMAVVALASLAALVATLPSKILPGI